MSDDGVGLSRGTLVPLQRMWQRAEVAREDSDTAFFYDLLILGELVVKLTTIGMLAALVEGRERHRYRLEYGLARANGLGEWTTALDELLVGPASQHILVEARSDHRDLTKRWKETEGSWQWEAVHALHEACIQAGVDLEPLPGTVSVRHWFDPFPALRNRTRAHGAPTGARCAAVCEPLQRSLRLVSDNLAIFGRPWAYLHRNLSGKYRVIPIGQPTDEFNYLKSEKHHTHADGVYLWFGSPSPAHLITTDVGLSDFHVANGDFKADHTYEGLSYVADTTIRMDGSSFTIPPGALPPSQTDARPTLEVKGETFTDIPPPPADYVERKRLEAELRQVLMEDERFPIVTLVGRGGVGKTSAALSVLSAITHDGTYFAILWFSARDIDLLEEGPRTVQPQVLTIDEIATQFVDKMNPERRHTKGFNPTQYLVEFISDRLGNTRLLLVLDNFETVRNPSDVYVWLSNAIRLPNKILITTRFRDFKADYPVDVGGMTEPEFEQLVKATAARLGIAPNITDSYVKQLYEECDGHPYIAKVMLGEAAVTHGQPNVKRILGSKDDVLDALFERTYSVLSPAAQRVFLTLCNWRSLVPRIAVEAALLRPVNERINVEEAIDMLQRTSLVELSVSESDRQEWLSVPLAAYLFGKRKLSVSPMQSAVEADTRILQAFGAAKGTDISHGLEPGVRRLVGRIAERLQDGEDISDLRAVLEYVAAKYARTWLHIADLSEEVGYAADFPSSKDAVRRYLEVKPTDTDAWRKLAVICRASGDPLGEVHARLRLATRPDATYEEISDAANRFNYLLSERVLNVDTDEKRVMAEKLREVMLPRVQEADATDCSRLAWLSLHLGDSDAARHYTERGLALEPANQYCIRLRTRLGM